VKLLLSIFGLLAWTITIAQTPSNDWIDYNQKHLRIDVTTNGIYRLDSTTLDAALASVNLTVAAVNPQDFRMFGRGQEIPIWIEGEGDGSFDGNDFIEFFARKNDGWLDTLMYDLPENQSNPYFNLYQDTAAYFLTVTPSTAGTPMRMQLETDVNFTAYTPAPWFWATSHKEEHNYYFKGLQRLEVSTSDVTEGEGWFGVYTPATGNALNWNVPTPAAFSGGPNARAQVTFASLNDPDPVQGATINHHMVVEYASNNVTGNVSVFDQQFVGYDFFNHSFSIGANEIGSANTTIKFTGMPVASSTSYFAVGHSTIEYPHQMDMENNSTFEFVMPNNPGNKSLLRFNNFSGAAPLVYDLTTGTRIPALLDTSYWHALVGNQAAGTRCFVSDENAINTVALSAIQPVNNDGSFTDFSTLAADSVYIILTHANLMNAASQYEAYRSNHYNTVLADIAEVYDQFGYGIRKHPYGVRLFIDYLVQTYPSVPSHLFLVGKAVRAAGTQNFHISSGSRTNATYYENNMVPTFGYPGSDMLYTYGLSGTNAPAVAVGRLAARTDGQVLDYLNKIIEYELAQQTPEEWMKQVLHFGGGSDVSEQNKFRNYLNAYEEIIEDTLYGGFVHEYFKNNSAPIQLSITDSFTSLINNGVSLMTFFGHASGDGFDVSLDEPGNYSNQGKYPILIGNSCYTGSIHGTTFSSTSEDFVLIADRGMIGFLASVNVGLDLYLHYYTLELYRQFSGDSHRKSLGQAMQNTVETYLALFGANNMFAVATAQTMSLHGDPGIRLNTFDLPDYAIEPTDVYFEPGFVTAEIDSFSVNVVLTNLGQAIPASFNVEIDHKFPDGTIVTDTVAVSNLHYKDTIVLRYAVDPVEHLGLNTFDVRVDLPSYIPELQDQINNQTFGAELLVVNSGLVPVYPYKYAIYPSSSVTLKASTGNPFAPSNDYIFEIDTTDLFNSPAKLAGIVTTTGGVVEWTPRLINGDTLELSDSVVYFWRVTSDTLWRESSFQYINGKSGWGQAHHFQFEDDAYSSISYERNPRRFDFNPNSKVMSAQVIGNPDANTYTETEFSLDFDLQMSGGCNVVPALHVVVVDSIELNCWGTFGHAIGDPTVLVNAQHQYGNVNNGPACLARTEQYFSFRQNNASQMSGLENMLTVIPDGNWLMIYTWFYTNYNGWDTYAPNLYSTLQQLGATGISPASQDSVPFIFMVKKGDPSTAITVMGDHIGDTVQLTYPMITNYAFGTVRSELAGPAEEWNALYWQSKSDEAPYTADSSVVRLFGVDNSGQNDLLASWDEGVDSVLNLDQIIDASIYPHAYIELFAKDDSTFSPTQLKRWQLLYEPVPEAALNASINAHFYNGTVSEGEMIEFAVAIENISDADMDSMLVYYWVEDANKNKTYIPYDRQAPLLVDGVLYDTVQFSTAGHAGANYFWVEANPIVIGTTEYDQLEQYHFNNFAVKSFTVSEDKINPVMDVTVDGTHIIDGEIVSAEPFILISLDDENPFLIMNEPSDTAFFQLFITDPDGVQKQLRFQNGNSDNSVVFNPALSSDNKCSIEYNPTLEKDGVYEMLVRAYDKSGNASGNLEYRISFEVINATTITEIFNYPNPFSTQTHFVFTLTGSEPPPYITIRVLTVTGRVVREITQDELGPLRIGRNMTDYAWDGKDEFGDQLANGVYLYQVIVKDDQLQDVEKRATAADHFIKKGFGKMYLMR